ncbi:hypothetical protein NF867_13845 [Solitalea sp. MAHUQ-68]|uniref:Cbb3-type cytochrome c oxidase subunit I n=1 Tax=Solitalea agri TaxID=2953739 RepID=A0A9X2F8Z7_9SPHI|nr:hypothetical protein [Solitalea agri]MCO4293943.1 hypothetical protein [Solitalea agri]
MSHAVSVKTVSAKMISAHYMAGSIAYLIVCVLVLMSGNAFAGHFFHPQLLAMVHLAALGWISMIIIGTTYLLVPVILDVNLYSNKLAYFSFFSLIAGVIGLACTFYHFITGPLMQVAALLLLASIGSYCFNLWKTTTKHKAENIQADFIQTALLWLLVTAILGTLLVFNFSYAFLPEDHLHYLKLHAHIGFAGWFLLLVMGVLSKLMPMFLLSKTTNSKQLRLCWYLVNGAICGFLIDMFFNQGRLSIVCWLLGAAGISCFANFLYSVWKNRMKRKVDLPMNTTYKMLTLGLVSVIIAAVLLILNNNEVFLQLAKTYGVLFLGGFLTGLVLAQTFKILPYIIWLELFKDMAGAESIPQPADLYNKNWFNLQFTFYIPGLVLLIAGIILKSTTVISFGGMLLLLSAFFYTSNIIKLIRMNVN